MRATHRGPKLVTVFMPTKAAEAGRLATWTATAALLTFAVYLLSRSPCLGVADNLDFWRVMRPAGIEHLEPVTEPGAFVQCRFATSESHLLSGVSSPALIAWSAKHLFRRPGEGPGRMDLRQIGLLYLLLVGVLAAAGVRWGAPPLLVVGWSFVFVDPGYLLFLNSFYADPALLIGLVGISIWFVQQDSWDETVPERRWRVAPSLALVSSVVLGGASKMQYALLPLVTLVAAASLALLRWRDSEAPSVRAGLSHRHILLASVLFIVAVAVPWHFFRGPAPRFVEVNNYHAVYAGLLQVTDQPARALRSLGVPREYWDLPRRDVWSSELPLDHPVLENLQGLSRIRLITLYLAEPGAIAAAAGRLGQALSAVETHRRGSFSREAGRRRWAQYAVPWQFSRLREWLSGRWPPVVWVLLGAAGTWLVVSALRGRWGGAEAGMLLLVLFAVSQLVIVVLGDGFVALEQHLLGARFALDLLLVLSLHETGLAALRRLRRRREAASRSSRKPPTGPTGVRRRGS